MFSPTRRRRRTGAIVAVVAAALIPAVAVKADPTTPDPTTAVPASTVTIGPTDLNTDATAVSPKHFSFVQVEDSQKYTLIAPADGVITTWRANLASAGTVVLEALTPQADGTYVERSSSQPLAGVKGLNTFTGQNASFVIRQGDVIALVLKDTASVTARPDADGVIAQRDDTKTPAKFVRLSGYYALFNADESTAPAPPSPPSPPDVPSVPPTNLPGGSTGGGDNGGGNTGGNNGGNTGGNTGGSTSTTDTSTQSTDTQSSDSQWTTQQPPAQQSSAPAFTATSSTPPASRVTVQRTAAHLRHGVARIRMSCSTGSGCSGVLRLVLPLAHGKQFTLGKATFAIRGNQRGVVAVRLTKAGRKAIVRRRGATVLALVTNLSGTTRSGLLLRAH